MRVLWTLTVASFLFLSSSCDIVGGERVRGSGNKATETRDLEGFNSITAGGAFRVILTQGSNYEVTVEADDNLMEYIDIQKRGEELVIRNKDHFNLDPRGNMIVRVTAPEYRRITVSGAGELRGETPISNPEQLDLRVSGAGELDLDVDSPVVGLDVSGSGDVKLRGKCRDLHAEVSGAGNIKAYELLSENASADISGAGDIDLYASVKLDAKVSGAGNISYKGDPKTVNQHSSGAGSINKR